MAGLLYHSFRQINEIQRTLRTLTRAGFGPMTEPYQAVYKLQGDLLGKLGLRSVKPMSLLKLLVGLSPGSVKVWHDAESGWFTEAREKPGAPPVYHHVSDDTAMGLLKGELTHELEAELMKPDEYLGE
jgi:hypothetical protein